MKQSDDIFSSADLDRIAVVDEMVTEVQNLAAMYVQFLAIDDRTPEHVSAEIHDGVFQAFARSFIASRSAIATIASTLTGNDVDAVASGEGDF